MDRLIIFGTIAVVYIAVAYILFFLNALLDDDFDYETYGFIVWEWPITIPCLLICLITFKTCDIWKSIKFPKLFRTFCCRSAYVLSLPFRPVTLGRLVRKRYHLS